MAAYKYIIDHTIQTIEYRTKNYRNITIAVIFLSIGFFLWAGISFSFRPLYGIFMLIPICGLYLYFDGKILNKWRHEVLGAWEKKEIDFKAFHEVITSLTTLPRETVKSMLETLPTADDLVTEQGISSRTRRAIAVIVNTINAHRCDRIGFKTLTFTVIGAAIVLSAMLWKWQPFLAILIIIVILCMDKYVKTSRIKGGYKKISHAKKQPDFDLEKFLKIVLALNWQSFSESEKNTLIQSITDTS